MLSGLVMVLALVGTVSWRTQALVSPRPDSDGLATSPEGTMQNLEARLWQDPIGAMQRGLVGDAASGRVAMKATELEKVATFIQENMKASDDSAVPGVEVILSILPGGLYAEDTETRLRARHAVVSALSTAGYRADDEEHLGVVELPWPDIVKDFGPDWQAAFPSYPEECKPSSTKQIPFEWFRKRLFDRSRNMARDRVLLLWVPDTLFSDDHVLPRLAQLVYAFRHGANGEMIDEKKLRVQILGPQGSSMLRMMLPWKNDPAKQNARGETAAEAERKSAEKMTPKPLAGVTMYSWSATSMDDLLVHGFAADHPREKIRDHLKSCWGLDFRNVIATDDVLAKELIEELSLRGVDLSKKENHLALISEWDTFYGRNIPVAFDVALPERRLTSAARSIMQWKQPGSPIATQFVEQYRYLPAPAGQWPALPLNGNLHPFTYLRGIDGKLPGDKRDVKDTTRPRSGSEVQQLVRLNDRDMNRPEGQNQLDYIPRLGDQLERLRADLRRNGGELKGIGVVGSDFYDKVLILQALRDRFPNAIFFTTDLDARFLQPEFLKWTRNLVIASSFGLSLHPRLQDDVPPFRNSYQTSLFFAALGALGMASEQELENPAARRFEIGRFHAVDLSVAKDSPEPIHPEIARRLPKGTTWWFLLGAVTAGACLIIRTFPDLRAWLTPGGRCRLVSRAILVRSSDLISPAEARTRWIELEPSVHAAGLEKNSIHSDFETAEWSPDGKQRLLQFFNESVTRFRLSPALEHEVSDECRRYSGWLIGLWRREWRWTVLSRAAAREQWEWIFPNVLRTARPRLKLLVGALRNCYIGVATGVVVTVGFVWAICHSHTSLGGEPFTIWEGTSTWPGEALRLVAFGLSVFFIGRVLHDLEQNRQEICEEFALPDPPASPRGQNRWKRFWKMLGLWRVFDWAPELIGGYYDGTKLWQDYQIRGQKGLRILRSLLFLALYMVFGISLSELAGGQPFVPTRGVLAQVIDVVVLLTSVLAFLMLNFLIVDATRLCRRFVLHLIDETKWPEETQRRFTAQNHGSLREDFDPWIDIQLIARLTVVVSRFVYYPFIVLSLLILARSRYFDAWDWPLFLVVIFVLNATWAFSSAWLLWKTAKQARTATLATLRKGRDVLQASEDKNKLRIAHFEKLIKDVEEIREGAFRPAYENPALKAALIPFTGGGLTLLLEFLTSR